MKIVTVIGARPQFIKAAPVSGRFASAQGVNEHILHTGQHHDANMSQVFFDELGVPEPKWNLGIGGGRHGAMTGRMLEAIEAILIDERPDWVLVYGDTNSTLAGGLAAQKLHIPVAHVEAGLRSFNHRMPEEVNRVLVDHLSSKLFAPTKAAMLNLEREGLRDSSAHLVGDVMFDAVLRFSSIAQRRTVILDELGLEPKNYVLATVHRAENTEDHTRLNTVVEQLIKVAQEVPVVFPMHPRTRKKLDRMQLLDAANKLLRVSEPLGYFDMMELERNASVIATDSGGVQKEAYFHGVPCVTLREETEWVELLDHGWNRICPPTAGSPIAQTVLGAIGTTGSEIALYGDGTASTRIVDLILNG